MKVYRSDSSVVFHPHHPDILKISNLQRRVSESCHNQPCPDHVCQWKMYSHHSTVTTTAEIYRTPHNIITNKQATMGTDSHRPLPAIARSRSFQVNNKPLPSTSSLTVSTSSLLTSVPISSSKSTRQFSYRRHYTWVQPESCRDQLSSFCSWPKSTHSKTLPSNEIHVQGQPKQCPVSTSLQVTAGSSRHQRLDRIHQVNIRNTSSSPGTSQTAALSCTRPSSLTFDSQKSSFTSELLDATSAAGGRSRVEESQEAGEGLTDEQIQRQMNIEKCLNWMAQLPAKFSSMYILQERVPVVID